MPEALKPLIADIAIAGASFAGLALALALSRATHGALRIALLERSAPTHSVADTRAALLSAGSRNVLTALGLWPDLAPLAQPVRRIEITDSSLDAGIRPVALAYDNTRRGEAMSHILPNAALRASLWNAVLQAPGVTVIAPIAVAALTPSQFSTRLDFSTSVNALVAPLAVAADGRHSTLREAAGIKTRGWPYRQVGIVCTIAHEVPHDGTAVQHFLPGGPFAILPLPHDGTGRHHCAITWSEDAAAAARLLALAPDAFLAELDTRIGGRLGAILVEGPVRSWPLELAMAARLIAPRLALVGDAARTVHPIAGQGLNLALRDVAALAEIITEALAAGGDIGAAPVLDRYQSWRGFDGTASALVFDGLNRLFSHDGMLRRASRDTGLQLLDRAGFLKALLVREAAGLAGTVPMLMRGT